jgi:hypothetical protein
MNTNMKLVVAALGIAGAAFLAGSLATAEPPKDHGMGDFKLPKGWTMEDMQTCMNAGMPGEMHAWMAKSAGTWNGKSTMWMAPDSEPMKSDCTSTLKSVMQGRYVQNEFAGDFPGMGPFSGMGFTGFDNVSQKFVGTWLDNHSTGIMTGTGTLSQDKKTLTWNYNYNCPITKTAKTMRQIETYTSPNEMTLEMFMTDPKTNVEYKMMRVEFTRAN